MSESLRSRLTEWPLSPTSVLVAESEGLLHVLTLAATYSGPDGTCGISAHSPLARTSHMATAHPKGPGWERISCGRESRCAPSALRFCALSSSPCSYITVFFWIPGEGSFPRDMLTHSTAKGPSRTVTGQPGLGPGFSPFLSV